MIKTFAFTILAIFAIAAIGIMWLYFLFVPTMYGVVTITWNEGWANITRELNGIPHVSADSWDMAYYSLGFMHSMDRLWQLDKMRRIS